MQRSTSAKETVFLRSGDYLKGWTMIRTVMMTALLASVLLTCNAAFADDVRDFLPNGKIFDLPNPYSDLDFTWSQSSRVLTVEYTVVSNGQPSTITLITTTAIDRLGRLRFESVPDINGSSDLSSVAGMIDIRPNGDQYIELEATYSTKPVAVLSAWSDSTLTTYALARCDCSDVATLTCRTDHCNAGEGCPGANPGATCGWADLIVH